MLVEELVVHVVRVVSEVVVEEVALAGVREMQVVAAVVVLIVCWTGNVLDAHGNLGYVRAKGFLFRHHRSWSRSRSSRSLSRSRIICRSRNSSTSTSSSSSTRSSCSSSSSI